MADQPGGFPENRETGSTAAINPATGAARPGDPDIRTSPEYIYFRQSLAGFSGNAPEQVSQFVERADIRFVHAFLEEIRLSGAKLGSDVTISGEELSANAAIDPVGGRESIFTNDSQTARMRLQQLIAAGLGGNFAGQMGRNEDGSPENDKDRSYEQLLLAIEFSETIARIQKDIDDLKERLDQKAEQLKNTLAAFDMARNEYDVARAEQIAAYNDENKSVRELAEKKIITIEINGRTRIIVQDENEPGTYYALGGKDGRKKIALNPEQVELVAAQVAAGGAFADEKTRNTHAEKINQASVCDARTGLAAQKLDSLYKDLEKQKSDLSKIEEELKTKEVELNKVKNEDRYSHIDREGKTKNISEQMRLMREQAAALQASISDQQKVYDELKEYGQCTIPKKDSAGEVQKNYDQFNAKIAAAKSKAEEAEKTVETSEEKITELKNTLQEDALKASLALADLHKSEHELEQLTSRGEAIQGEILSLAASRDTLSSQILSIDQQRNSIAQKAMEISSMRDEVIKNISESPYETRKEYLQEAYGGALAFHSKNMAGMSDPAKGIPVVKTTDGREVFNSGEGLYTKALDAQGEEMRVPLTDPYEVANANMQAWGKPPLRFGNEGPDTNAGLLSNFGKMLTHIANDENKRVSELRVSEAAASINTSLESVNLQLLALESEKTRADSELSALSEKHAQLTAESSALEEKMKAQEEKLAELRGKIEAQQDTILADIRSGIITSETMKNLRDASTPEFLAKIDNEILGARARQNLLENDLVPLLDTITELERELITVNVSLKTGEPARDYVVFEDECGDLYILDGGHAYDVSDFEERDAVYAQIEKQELKGERFGSQDYEMADMLSVALHERHLYAEQARKNKAELESLLASRQTVQDSVTGQENPALAYDAQGDRFGGQVEAQIEAGVIKASDLDRILAEAPAGVQQEILEKLARDGVAIEGHSVVANGPSQESVFVPVITLSAHGATTISAGKNEGLLPQTVTSFTVNDEDAQTLKEHEYKPEESAPAPNARPTVSMSAIS